MDTKLNRQTHVLLTWDLDDGISRLVWNGNLAKIILIVNRKVIFARRGFLIFPIQPDSATVISTAAAAAASTVVVAALEEEEEGACMVDCCLLFSLLIIN